MLNVLLAKNFNFELVLHELELAILGYLIFYFEQHK